VDQDRDPALGGELEDGVEARVFRVEALGARMQLDPACPCVEAPPRLL
jgi:hypothetical protein